MTAEAFCIWITGLPASGKSSITAVLSGRLRHLELPVVVLESDSMRRILTPQPSYLPEERERFYDMLSAISIKIASDGINVIIDATASRRSYRDRVRVRIPRFVEVYVECPLETCIQRDPKGIYRHAGRAGTVPGLHEPYEPPKSPDLVLRCEISPEANADIILDKLHQLLYI